MSTFMRLSTFSFLFVALASSITACSSDDDNPGQQPPRPDGGTDSGPDTGKDGGDDKPDGSVGANPREAIVKACTDWADAAAKAIARCGGEYQAAYDGLLAVFGGPTCPKVEAVVNESTLRGQCLPSLGTVSCSDLLSDPPRVDASCKEQFLVRERLMQRDLAPQAATGESTMRLLQVLVDER